MSTSYCFSGWQPSTSRPAISPQSLKRENQRRDSGEDLLAPALAICEKALVWVEPKAPWLALEARLRASGKATMANGSPWAAKPGQSPAAFWRAASDRNVISSSLACFQWGVLAYRADRLSRAIEWLERAARLEGGENYWYQFLLGYLQDKAGYTDEALRNYSIAVPAASACGRRRPGSSSAEPGSIAREAAGTGPAKTSMPPRTSSREARGDQGAPGARLISTSRWATSIRRRENYQLVIAGRRHRAITPGPRA